MESKWRRKGDETKDSQDEASAKNTQGNEAIWCGKGLEVDPRQRAEDGTAGELRIAEAMHRRNPLRSRRTVWQLGERIGMLGPLTPKKTCGAGLGESSKGDNLPEGAEEDPQEVRVLRRPGMTSRE